MNFIKRILIYLGVLSFPFVLMGLTFWLFKDQFGSSMIVSILMSVGSLVLMLTILNKYMDKVREKEGEIVSTLDHPYLGKVSRKIKSWEAKIDILGLGEGLRILGHKSIEPLENQISTIKWIEANLIIIIEGLEDSLDGFNIDGDGFPIRPRLFVVDSLMLDDTKINSFKLMFNVSDSTVEWGFYADYENGVLSDFGVNH